MLPSSHVLKDDMGITYSAELVIDQPNQAPPLEVLVVTFDEEYYQSNQGIVTLIS